MTDKNSYDFQKGWGKVNAQRLAAILKYGGVDILDVGCATGDYVEYLNRHGYHAKGCDIKEYPEWNGKDFFIADANCLSLPPDSVDTITCFEVLEHLHQPLHALASMHRACRKNLIVSVPNCSQHPALSASGLNFNHYIDRSHCNFWTPETICKLAVEAGFKITQVELINQVHPESLFLANLKLPRLISGWVGWGFDHLPWVVRYYMTILVVANK